MQSEAIAEKMNTEEFSLDHYLSTTSGLPQGHYPLALKFPGEAGGAPTATADRGDRTPEIRARLFDALQAGSARY